MPIREIKSQVGDLLRDKPRAPDAVSGQPLLEVEHVSKTYALRKGGLFGQRNAPRVTAVDDISFTIHRGECLGLVGESGCGKTTASKLIMRATAPDSGSIRFHDGQRMVDVLALRDEELFCLPAQGSNHFPGPVLVAEPAHDGVRHHFRAPDHSRHRR